MEQLEISADSLRRAVSGVSMEIDMPAQAMASLSIAGNELAENKEVTERLSNLAWFDGDRASTACSRLKGVLGNGPEGWRMLWCMLAAAGTYTRDEYERLDINDSVFHSTMGAFSRFVNEHQASYKRYGFDRDFWTWRQTSLRLFRLGELEYELTGERSHADELRIQMHIPSDARLTPLQCDASLSMAHEFVSEHFPAWRNAPVHCESWMLSPALSTMLPRESNLIRFQNRFRIERVDEQAQDWREWVFQRNDAPIADLPEHTSLQRAMKRHLLSGGTVGVGFGVLR